MTAPSITDLLKYADLQMASEAFLVSNDPPYALKADLLVALKVGNNHASKFTEIQAKQFLLEWEVVAQQPNTGTGFSGTLFKKRGTDELVMSFRSTEFVDDAARDNQATNDLEIKTTGFAWGQIRDMEAWYAQLLQEGKVSPGTFSVTGYSLGGHLATAFNLLHPKAATQVVTFNGAGVGLVKAGETLGALVQQFASLTSNGEDGEDIANFHFANEALTAIYERVRGGAALFKHSLKLALLGGAVFALSACAGTGTGTGGASVSAAKERQTKAIAMWKERCKTSGEFIHETVEGVEGFYLMKVRNSINFGEQFALTDPYGHDSTGEGSIEWFLKHEIPDVGNKTGQSFHPRDGYRYVVAPFEKDKQLYRYTGAYEATRKMILTAPGVQRELKKDPNFDTNIYDFVLHKTPATEPLPRYAVTYDDISTREEREYWIAGSSLKVIDRQTNQVIAERIGYMVDWAQGSQAGGRSPWLFAADYACPDFFTHPTDPTRRLKSAYQGNLTYRFVSKILKPKN